MYAYCNNDPVNYADPSGHWIETVFDLFSLGASVVEVVINPANPWAWAGLVGDAVDLLPFVTCVGESVRATKLVKYVDDVGDAMDSSYDTIKFVKAADMADDFDFGINVKGTNKLDEILDGFNHSGGKYDFTISNHVDGTKLHTRFMNNGGLIPGTRLRYDGLKGINLYELKPYNIPNARRGVRQLIKYNEALGGGHKMIVVFY